MTRSHIVAALLLLAHCAVQATAAVRTELTTVAVLDFKNSTIEKHHDALERSLPNGITHLLTAQKDISVVSREQTRGLLFEQSLSELGLTDDNKASRPVSADIIVGGELFQRGERSWVVLSLIYPGFAREAEVEVDVDLANPENAAASLVEALDGYLLTAGRGTDRHAVSTHQPIGSRLAVWDFRVQDPALQAHDLSIGFAEMLTVHLSQTQTVDIVERMEIDKILDEHQTSMAGMTDRARCIKTASLAGAHLCLAGSLVATNNVVEVDVFLLDTTYGVVLRSFQDQAPIDRLHEIAASVGLKLCGYLEGTDSVTIPASSDVARHQEALKYIQRAEHYLHHANYERSIALTKMSYFLDPTLPEIYKIQLECLKRRPDADLEIAEICTRYLTYENPKVPGNLISYSMRLLAEHYAATHPEIAEAYYRELFEFRGFLGTAPAGLRHMYRNQPEKQKQIVQFYKDALKRHPEWSAVSQTHVGTAIAEMETDIASQSFSATPSEYERDASLSLMSKLAKERDYTGFSRYVDSTIMAVPQEGLLLDEEKERDLATKVALLEPFYNHVDRDIAHTAIERAARLLYRHRHWTQIVSLCRKHGVQDLSLSQDDPRNPYIARGTVSGQIGGEASITARLVDVRTSHVLTSLSVDGVIRKDLDSMLARIAAALATAIPAGEKRLTPPTRLALAMSPEGLIMFYAGIDACTKGRPNEGVIWFMHAYGLDPDFAPARVWEVKAYQMMGLSGHAEIAARQLSALPSVKSALPSILSSDASASKRTLSVLTPVIHGRDTIASNNTLDAQALKVALENAVIESGTAHVFDPTSIDRAAAEQDLVLSGLFRDAHVSRYGRWSASTAVLLSELRFDSGPSVTISMRIYDLLRGEVAAQASATGSLQNCERDLHSLVGPLLANWTPLRMDSQQPALGPEPIPLRSDSINDSLTSMGVEDEALEGYRALVQGLIAVQREPELSSVHMGLANAFAGCQRARHAALEIEACLDQLDPRADHASMHHYNTFKWLHYSGPISYAITSALRYVDKTKIEVLKNRILDSYPDTLGYAGLTYDMARTAWHRGDFATAIDYCDRTATALGRSPRLSEGWGELLQNVEGASYYIKGSCLFHLNQYEEALQSFAEAMDTIKTVKHSVIPIGPSLRLVKGIPAVISTGGEGATSLRRVLIEEMATVKQHIEGSTSPPYEMCFDEALREPSRIAKWKEVLEQLEAFWRAEGASPAWIRPDNEDQKHMEVSARSLWGAYHHSAPNRNKLDEWERTYLAPGVHEAKIALEHLGTAVGEASLIAMVTQSVDAYLGGESLAKVLSDSDLPSMAFEVHLWTLTTLYETAGLQAVLNRRFDACMDGGCPLSVRFQLLSLLPHDLAALEKWLLTISEELPEGKVGIPGKHWAALAQKHAAAGNQAQALASYRQALASSDPSGARSGLAPFLVMMALESSGDSAPEQVRNYCRDLGLSPWLPEWRCWFDTGYNLQSMKRWREAAVCFHYVKQFLENPHEIDSRYTVGIYKYYAAVPVLLAGEDKMADARWTTEYKNRWGTSAYHLVLSYIATDQPEKAAAVLREIVNTIGEAEIHRIQLGGMYRAVKLGVMAELLLAHLRTERYDQPEERTWTLESGKNIEGTFVRMEHLLVYIRTDAGRQLPVSRHGLSADDNAYLDLITAK
ncbi:MAG: hypothetical protein HQ523_16330 [Lentisphaerae bacterium]|nr:hypothetical protein [Lentisphaerota bacterium]